MYQQWIYGKHKCHNYNGKVPRSSGIICANSGLERYPGIIYGGVWHVACYIKCEENNFLILGRDDLDDLLMEVNKLQSDYPHNNGTIPL